MRNTKLLFSALVVIMVVWGLNYLAGVFYLYWTLWWFDYLVHFLAGLGGGFFVLWFLSNRDLSGRQILLIVLTTVLFVGVVWEIYEYLFGLTQSTESYYTLDVISDLIMDGLGAITAVFLTKRR